MKEKSVIRYFKHVIPMGDGLHAAWFAHDIDYNYVWHRKARQWEVVTKSGDRMWQKHRDFMIKECKESFTLELAMNNVEPIK